MPTVTYRPPDVPMKDAEDKLREVLAELVPGYTGPIYWDTWLLSVSARVETPVGTLVIAVSRSHLTVIELALYARDSATLREALKEPLRSL